MAAFTISPCHPTSAANSSPPQQSSPSHLPRSCSSRGTAVDPFPPLIPCLVASPATPPSSCESWNSLFSASSKIRQLLPSFHPVVVDGIAEVPCEVEDKGVQTWSKYLVGYFVGGKLPFKMVKNAVEKQWKINLKSMATDQDMFFFNFNNTDERQIALEQGSLFIAGKLFIVKPWSIQVEEIPIWVNFYNVPKALWSEEGLAFVASRLGKPWCMDDATAGRDRLTFARIRIEVGIDFEYPKLLKFKLKNGVIISVDAEYPGKPPCCSKCKAFGHTTTHCGVRVVRAWKPVNARTNVRMPTSDGQVSSSQQRVGNDVEQRPTVQVVNQPRVQLRSSDNGKESETATIEAEDTRVNRQQQVRPVDSIIGKENPIAISNAFGVLEFIGEEQADSIGDSHAEIEKLHCSEEEKVNRIDSMLEAPEPETSVQKPQAERGNETSPNIVGFATTYPRISADRGIVVATRDTRHLQDPGGTSHKGAEQDLEGETELARLKKSQEEADLKIQRVMARMQQQNLVPQGPTLRSAGKTQMQKKIRTKT